ncbi:hypothetical protein ACFS6H_20025 [Terrimonas rubra]|uniref:Uncharacterized protein n=1 Tax=Terrimonas rubra TaxID=1035890 RepID=A0ABW6A9H7_9BACT
MKLWTTEIKAIDPLTGELKTWFGDYVQAPTFELAQQWCEKNKGYLKVTGELIAEIPFKEGTDEPDWGKKVDFDVIYNN